MTDQHVVALAGGVGGAKLARGLQLALDQPAQLTVIVNTADDFDLYGLRICPDLDTVMYTLAGLANPITGWGIQDDTFATLGMIERYAGKPWFLLGDRDFGTHIVRTDRLRRGAPLSQVTDELSSALGIEAAIVPMTDAPVATMIDTPEGTLDFQQYFVARQHSDTVLNIHFTGIDASRPSEPAVAAIHAADVIVFCPSNPIVSIGPILGVPGMIDLLTQAQAPKIAVSPIVGGKALKGPAAHMLESLEHEVSALGVARMYRGIIDGFVVDRSDEMLMPDIAALDVRVLVTGTIMNSESDRRSLARDILGFANDLVAERPRVQ